MGILNVTPDSFFEDSRVSEKDLLQRAGQMLNDGASILDIGGQSTRPGASQVGEQEELNRVLPAIESIRNEYPEAWLSIDTYHAKVARAAVLAGADIVNDISAGLDDVNMLETVAQLQVPYIAMHKKGSVENMQENPEYLNPTKEVIEFFIKQLNVIKSHGIQDCIIDPGFGFGKTVNQNYQILNELQAFNIFSEPLLIGISRKSLIYKALNTSPEYALNGSTFLHAIALQKGANILRVHDVKEASECILLFNLLHNAHIKENT
jgi:dihydropteroate synthase